jgi:hypothetical protein
MSAEIVQFRKATPQELSAMRAQAYPQILDEPALLPDKSCEPAGAGAREAIINYLEGLNGPSPTHFGTAESLLAWLWISGFKIVRVGDL